MMSWLIAVMANLLSIEIHSTRCYAGNHICVYSVAVASKVTLLLITLLYLNVIGSALNKSTGIRWS